MANDGNYTTELYDLLCDLNFSGNTTRYSYLSTSIPETIYANGLVNYDSNSKKWSIKLPDVNYEYSYIGFRAFKPILISGKTYDKFFFCCSIANNSNKRVAFDYSNLTDGLEMSPLNQNNIIEFWLEDPIRNSIITLNTISQYYYSIIIELDLYIRK